MVNGNIQPCQGKKEDLAQLCELLGLFVRFRELSLELSLHMN